MSNEWITVTYRDRCNLRAVGVSGADYAAHWDATTIDANAHEVTLDATGAQWLGAVALRTSMGRDDGVRLSFAGAWELRELAAFLAAVVEAQHPADAHERDDR